MNNITLLYLKAIDKNKKEYLQVKKYRKKLRQIAGNTNVKLKILLYFKPTESYQLSSE